MRGLQVDNQLPLTPMPVLFRPHRAGEESDHVLKLSLTVQSNGSLDLYTYPYIEVQVSQHFKCPRFFCVLCSYNFFIVERFTVSLVIC